MNSYRTTKSSCLKSFSLGDGIDSLQKNAYAHGIEHNISFVVTSYLDVKVVDTEFSVTFSVFGIEYRIEGFNFTFFYNYETVKLTHD
jgi:hypothetical protein